MFSKIFKKLFCSHNYVFRQSVSLAISGPDTVYGEKEIYMCKNCLKIKRVRLW